MDDQPTPPGFDRDFYTRTLIRVHFFVGLVAATVVGKIADMLGYNATPWAFGAAGVTMIVLVVWIVVRRIRARREGAR